jgi:hypothetical protein
MNNSDEPSDFQTFQPENIPVITIFKATTPPL